MSWWKSARESEQNNESIYRSLELASERNLPAALRRRSERQLNRAIQRLLESVSNCPPDWLPLETSSIGRRNDFRPTVRTIAQRIDHHYSIDRAELMVELAALDRLQESLGPLFFWHGGEYQVGSMSGHYTAFIDDALGYTVSDMHGKSRFQPALYQVPLAGLINLALGDNARLVVESSVTRNLYVSSDQITTNCKVWRIDNERHRQALLNKVKQLEVK